jgi:hypothetical protein
MEHMDERRSFGRRLSMHSIPLVPTPPPPYSVEPSAVLPAVSSPGSSIRGSSPVVSEPSSLHQVGVNPFVGENWELTWRLMMESCVNPQQMPMFDAALPGLAEQQNRENEGEQITGVVEGPAATVFTPPVPLAFASPELSASVPGSPLSLMARMVADAAMSAARQEVEDEVAAKQLALLIGSSEGTQTTPSLCRRRILSSTSSQLRPLSTVSDGSTCFVDASEGTPTPEPSVKSDEGSLEDTTVSAMGVLEESPIRSTPRPRMLFLLSTYIVTYTSYVFW